MKIPKDMDEDLLLPFFSEFGPVAELTVIRDKINQTHKGFVTQRLPVLLDLFTHAVRPNSFVGCAFLTYCMQQSARRAVDQLHDKIKLPNVRI